MDEELQKRNTDCVYFLASPLTCKKGIDCEYRHSEIARLNPRDCWYWLSGDCLNPTCAFRHPPLDGHAGAAPESAHCSTPVNKTNVPCYFYFNGLCNKGDRCSFMHGPDGNAPAGKSIKTASRSSDAPALENKTSAGSETGSATAETHLNPSESASKVPINFNFLPKEELQQAVPKILFLQSASPQIAVCEYDDAVIRSESLIPAEGFIQGRSHICTDQSSEEQVEDHIEPEERWESSPGFDVLVDDKSENLGYEDDPEYLLDLDREHRELNSHFLVYGFEDSVEYDPMYPDAELLREHGICDGFDHLDDEHLFTNVEREPGHSRSKMLGSILSGKRKLVPLELAVGDCNDMDLRDHLRKRRVIDGCQITGSSRRHGSSHLINRSQKRHPRHGMGQRLHRRRLAPEVGKNTIESLRENGTFLNGANQHGLLRRSHQDRSKKNFRKRRLPKRHFSSEVSRKPIERERRTTRESTMFTGPKTLAQIKEEKKKTEDNADCIWKVGNSSRTKLADFQGPKPLSEILKGKWRLDSVSDSDISGR
ncbi:zinc finger CCCH domain-containing protein 34-like [Corylus avellana]|uniref:zinc finger CCCH domain-containing protein 34-like n=1 Tax=Corylus avellana TaxID=13451 RepID=UPI00286AF38B|nr:zinc finger CCCH domain-containing protein 34-like [Corylus avellana]